MRDRCGDPFYADTYISVEVFGAYGPVEQQREVQYDVWYYNFGPRDLMRRFVFRDGVLVREETLGYGVNEIGGDCNPNRDYTGVSVGELVARCGEPASRRRAYDTIVRRPVPVTNAGAITPRRMDLRLRRQSLLCACSAASMAACVDVEVRNA